jgi:hypothetical protein
MEKEEQCVACDTVELKKNKKTENKRLINITTKFMAIIRAMTKQNNTGILGPATPFSMNRQDAISG